MSHDWRRQFHSRVMTTLKLTNTDKNTNKTKHESNRNSPVENCDEISLTYATLLLHQLYLDERKVFVIAREIRMHAPEFRDKDLILNREENIISRESITSPIYIFIVLDILPNTLHRQQPLSIFIHEHRNVVT